MGPQTDFPQRRGWLAWVGRVASCVFVTAFVGLMLVQPLSSSHSVRREVRSVERTLRPLRLFSPWRMFVGRARPGYVNVEGELADGQRVWIANFRHEGKSFLARARDARLRKMHAKLKRTRAWRSSYMGYLCREGRARFPDMWRLRLVLRKPRIRDVDGQVVTKARRRTLFTHDCDAPKTQERKRKRGKGRTR